MRFTEPEAQTIINFQEMRHRGAGDTTTPLDTLRDAGLVTVRPANEPDAKAASRERAPSSRSSSRDETLAFRWSIQTAQAKAMEGTGLGAAATICQEP